MSARLNQPPMLEKANAMPATTWHFLKMNDVDIALPPDLDARPLVRFQAVGDTAIATSGKNALDVTIREMQERWEATHPAPTDEERAEQTAALAAEADATYGGTALSAYQAGADALEEQRGSAIAPQGGMGAAVDAFLLEAPHEPIAITCEPGGTVEAHVIVSANPGLASLAVIDVVAGEGSVIKLAITVDSDDEADKSTGTDTDTTPNVDAAQSLEGIVGTFVRICAGPDAFVNVTRTQTLADGFMDLDDMAVLLDKRSHVEIRQTVLGAGAAYAGLSGDLRSDDSRVDVDARYLGRKEQLRDFNYLIRHHGKRTRCSVKANGVLADRSCKTLRATIDLIRGCKGSEGSESETVLLVDEDVHNRSVPVILCNEDDVAGNHGATIGHIREEQLFYLASRGLSQNAAEAMFVNAAIERAAIDAPDDVSNASVMRYGERVTPGFAERFLA